MSTKAIWIVYVYFVSYQAQVGTTLSTSWYILNLPGKINSIETMTSINETIKARQKANQLTILNVSLLDEIRVDEEEMRRRLGKDFDESIALFKQVQ